MSFGVTYKVKNLFFDRALVRREVGKLNAAALSKIGSFVRTRARTSMRRRKSASAIGSPPSVHSRDKVATLRNILFAYDRANMSVVIGPVRLNGSQGTVPALHEFGGRGLGRKLIRRQGKREIRGPLEQVQFPPRPFMGPALTAEAPKFPSLWTATKRAA